MSDPSIPPPISGRRRVWLPIIAVIVAAVAVGVLFWAFLGARPYAYRIKDPSSSELRSDLARTIAGEAQELDRETERNPNGSVSDPLLDRLRLVWAIEAYRLQREEFPDDLRALAAAGLLPDTRLIEKYVFEVSDGHWKLRDRKTNRTIAVGN